MNFDLKRPCHNCPFIRDTEMVLRPGRMQGIAQTLECDYQVFPCHKTTHHYESEEEDGYMCDGREQACMGALAYTLRFHGRLPVAARIAAIRNPELVSVICNNFDDIEEPGHWLVE